MTVAETHRPGDTANALMAKSDQVFGGHVATAKVICHNCGAAYVCHPPIEDDQWHLVFDKPQSGFAILCGRDPDSASSPLSA